MLKGNQIKALELMIEGSYKDTEIAEECNITRQTLHSWKTENKEFQEEYEKLMWKKLKYASSKAMRKQTALLNSRNDMVAHLAAKDLLDRAGFNSTDKIDLNADVDSDIKITISYGDEKS